MFKLSVSYIFMYLLYSKVCSLSKKLLLSSWLTGRYTDKNKNSLSLLWCTRHGYKQSKQKKTLVHNCKYIITSELGTSLFEIAQLLFALERTFILGAMALLETKSEALWANWQNQISSGPLMSDIRIKERRKNGWKRHKNARFIHILIKIPARQPPPPPPPLVRVCRSVRTVYSSPCFRGVSFMTSSPHIINSQ